MKKRLIKLANTNQMFQTIQKGKCDELEILLKNMMTIVRKKFAMFIEICK